MRFSKTLLFTATAILVAAACGSARADQSDPNPPRRQPVFPDGSVNVGGLDVSYTLRPAEPIQFPGWADSNSPAYWRDGEMVLFNSAFYPTRTTGTSLDALGQPDAVINLDRHRGGGMWIEAVWPDQESSILYGWYHLEPDDLPCLTAPFIGAAMSFDDGVNWWDLGPVLESPRTDRL